MRLSYKHVYVSIGRFPVFAVSSEQGPAWIPWRACPATVLQNMQTGMPRCNLTCSSSQPSVHASSTSQLAGLREFLAHRTIV